MLLKIKKLKLKSKTILIIPLIGLLISSSCKSGNKKVSISTSEEIETSEKPTIDTLENYVIEKQVTIDKDTLNFTDSLGRKQGEWHKYLYGKLWKIENYKDNLLHGKFYKYFGNGEVISVEYVNGIQHGYDLHYHPDSTSARFCSFFEHGEKIWFTFPEIIEIYNSSVKGQSIYRDTVEMIVPYNSGKILYKGTFISNGDNYAKEIGIHKSYYESGEIKALIDYDNDSIILYSKEGKIIESKNFIF